MLEEGGRECMGEQSWRRIAEDGEVSITGREFGRGTGGSIVGRGGRGFRGVQHSKRVAGSAAGRNVGRGWQRVQKKTVLHRGAGVNSAGKGL